MNIIRDYIGKREIREYVGFPRLHDCKRWSLEWNVALLTPRLFPLTNTTSNMEPWAISRPQEIKTHTCTHRRTTFIEHTIISDISIFSYSCFRVHLSDRYFFPCDSGPILYSCIPFFTQLCTLENYPIGTALTGSLVLCTPVEFS